MNTHHPPPPSPKKTNWGMIILILILIPILILGSFWAYKNLIQKESTPNTATNQSTQSNTPNNTNDKTNNQQSVDPQHKSVADILTKGTWQTYDEFEDRLSKVTFNQPQVENGLLTGESTMETHANNACLTITKRKYTILSNTQYKTTIISQTCDGQNDPTNVGSESIFYYELYIDNNGNQALAVGRTTREMQESVPYTLLR